MNQKMPYFAIHDSKHLVCLSRNRMYVNMMSLESGDCLTTFKAGEDRFLNSLLVSGDGRILVCGDETRYFFPPSLTLGVVPKIPFFFLKFTASLSLFWFGV